jgi:hypothetical protein
MKKGKRILAWLLCVSMAANSGMTALAADAPAEDSQTIELTGDDLQDFLDSLEEGESFEEDSEDKEELATEEVSADEEEAGADEGAGKQEDEAASDADEKISGAADDSDEAKETVDDEILADEDLIFDLATASDAVLDVDLLPEIDLIDIELASASNASSAEIAPIALRYEIYADEDTQLQKDDLTGTGKKLYEALEDCLKKMDETQSLIIKISLGELGTFRSECDEDGNYDEDEAILAAEEIGAEWKDALQEAYGVFSSEYGEYLWFDHLVLMLDSDGTYEEEDNVINWTVEGSTGLPTDLTFDEIEEKLNAILSAMASYQLVISNGVLSGYTGSPTTITIPSTVTSINDNAFKNCTTLKEVYIPGTVKSIGSYAFNGCTALRKVTLNEGTTSIGKYAFSECSLLSSVTIPATVTTGVLAFYGCTGLRSATVKGTLDNNMFGNCTELRTVDLNTSISEIPNCAFAMCTSLTSISLPDNVKTIGEFAFSGCTALSEMKFPSKLKIIGWCAFYNCKSLETVDLTKTQVTEIEAGAFSECIGVTSVNLPASLSLIGTHAFAKCNMKTVNILSSKIEIQAGAFNNCASLRTANLPGGTTFENVTTLPGVFEGCAELTKVTLGEGITTIPTRMFSGCTSLKTITLPSTVKSIEEQAFNGCSTLTSITIPASVTSIDSSAFLNDSKVTIYGYVGTTAETFAKAHSIPFVDMSADVQNFVIRLYDKVLGRTPDKSGLTYWASELINGKKTGATVAANVIFSSEYTKKNVSDEEFIKTLYRSMMGREADNGGLKSWKEYLDNGVSREYVFRKFVLSSEFKKICTTYGITQGTYTLKQNRDKNYKVTQFVNRCYTQALGRKGDASGLNSWTGTLLTKKKPPKAVAKSFVFSGEATKKNLNNTEFVKMLYRLYMGREADNGGLKYWVGLLNKGTSRQKVNDSMAGSKEFTEIVKSYGL